MPRYSAIFALVIFAAAAFADVVPTVQWDVETGRLTPVPYALSIRRGESVNIQPRFLTYNSPMVLTGSTVQLRYWYNGQTGYYATTGALMAATGRVHVAWYDALCPASNALNYEVRVAIGTNVLARGYGPLSLLTGSGGTETNGQVRTSINWSLIDQTGGMAVLSNQMGSGASWSGSAWVFGTADLSWSNNYYRASNPSNYAPASITNGLYPSSNPSNYITATATNGLYPSSNPSNYAPASVTNGLLPTAATNGWEVGSHTGLLPTVATNGAEWGSHAGLATHAQATSAAQAVVSAWGAVTNVDALGPTSAVVVANGATAVATDWVLAGVTFGSGILGRAGVGSGTGTLTNAPAPIAGQLYRVIYSVVVSNGCSLSFGYGGASWVHADNTVATYTNVMTASTDTKLQITITTDDDLSYAHGIRIDKLATATMDGTVDARRMMLGGTNLTSLFLQGITAAQIGAAGGLTNGGVTINGSPITNGAVVTIAASAGKVFSHFEPPQIVGYTPYKSGCAYGKAWNLSDRIVWYSGYNSTASAGAADIWTIWKTNLSSVVVETNVLPFTFCTFYAVRSNTLYVTGAGDSSPPGSNFWTTTSDNPYVFSRNAAVRPVEWASYYFCGVQDGDGAAVFINGTNYLYGGTRTSATNLIWTSTNMLNWTRTTTLWGGQAGEGKGIYDFGSDFLFVSPSYPSGYSGNTYAIPKASPLTVVALLGIQAGGHALQFSKIPFSGPYLKFSGPQNAFIQWQENPFAYWGDSAGNRLAYTSAGSSGAFYFDTNSTPPALYIYGSSSTTNILKYNMVLQ